MPGYNHFNIALSLSQADGPLTQALLQAIDVPATLELPRSPMLELPRFKAAAVQTAPVFLDTDATVEKSSA
jgi:hypothetical protein